MADEDLAAASSDGEAAVSLGLEGELIGEAVGDDARGSATQLRAETIVGYF